MEQQITFGTPDTHKRVDTSIVGRNNKEESVFAQISTIHSDGSEPEEPEVESFPQSSLTFNDQGVKNIAKLVFKGMQGC